MELASCDLTIGTTTKEIARKAQIPESFLNQIMLTTFQKCGSFAQQARCWWCLRFQPGTKYDYSGRNCAADGWCIGTHRLRLSHRLRRFMCQLPEPDECRLRILMRSVRDAIANIFNTHNFFADLIRLHAS